MGDKIDRWMKANREAKRVADDVCKATGADRHDNDKHRLTANFVGLDGGMWSDMKINVHASYGYYGSSSGYSASSTTLGADLAEAITEALPSLARRAVKIAQERVEVARAAAADEARSVIAKTNSCDHGIDPDSGRRCGECDAADAVYAMDSGAAGVER